MYELITWIMCVYNAKTHDEEVWTLTPNTPDTSIITTSTQIFQIRRVKIYRLKKQ